MMHAFWLASQLSDTMCLFGQVPHRRGVSIDVHAVIADSKVALLG